MISILEAKGREAGVYFTAAELMKTTFPEPKWAVPGLVAEGLNLLVGSPKLGKSWLVLGLGVAIASGGVALGKVPVEQGSVLYAALEDTPRRLQGRLRSVLNGIEAPEGLHITTFLPRGADMVDTVSEWLEAHTDARLVIVDVLRKVTPRSDGRNLYEADYDAMGALESLADRHKVAVIAVHYTRSGRQMARGISCTGLDEDGRRVRRPETRTPAQAADAAAKLAGIGVPLSVVLADTLGMSPAQVDRVRQARRGGGPGRRRDRPEGDRLVSYKDVLTRLSSTTEARVVAVHARYAAGEIDLDTAVALVAGIVATANGKATALADLALAATVMLALRRPVPVLGLLPAAGTADRLTKAATTLLTIPDVTPERVARLGRAEPSKPTGSPATGPCSSTTRT